MIEKQTGVKASQMNEVEIFDAFSFISVPFQEAELILQKFQNKTSRSSFTVVKAKDNKKGGGGSGSKNTKPGREKVATKNNRDDRRCRWKREKAAL